MTAITQQAGVFDKATDTFIKVFTGYQSHFLQWGEIIFFCLLFFNLTLLCWRYAYSGNSFDSVVPDFLMEFFTVGFFFTLMLHFPYLASLIKTAEFMGNTLVHHPLTPSAIAANGLAIGGKILAAAEKASLLTAGTGVLIALITYGIMLFVFFSISIDLAVTLIIAWWLATMSALFLGFAGHRITRNIAKHCLDALLGNCVKLLCLYLIVGVGINVVNEINQNTPLSLDNMDTYGWLILSALLLWAVNKTFTHQAVSIVSHAVGSARGVDAAAAVMAATQTLSQVKTTGKDIASVAARSTGLPTAVKTLGGALNNAAAHFQKSTQGSTDSLKNHAKNAVKGAGRDTVSSVGSFVSDQFRNLSGSLRGESTVSVQSVSSRLHEKAEKLREKPVAPQKK